MCIGHMQILCHVIYKTWAYFDIGTHGGPGNNPCLGTEDERVGWHHWLDGHEFEQATGLGYGQGCLACHSPCGCKELDTAEWNELARYLGQLYDSHLLWFYAS